jgi:two-component system sensor histidine kinase DegS
MITLNVILLLSPLLIVSMITVELEWRRKERRIFAEREKERKVYLLKELEVQEDERRRVSQELHDETIQTLLAIANRANALGISGDDSMETVKNDIMWIKDTILQTIDDIRRICINLRPAALDNLGLIDSLRLIVDNINTEHTICSQFLIDGTEHKLSPQAEVMIFRVVQEALNNIKRHSNATKAVVAVKFDNECLTITINDNGKGFHIPKTLDMLATKRKFGLIGMQQRIISLNGTFRIYSRPGEGTSILIKINYESDIAGSNNVYSSSSSSKVC